MQKNRYHTNGMIPCPILLYEELKSCCKKNLHHMSRSALLGKTSAMPHSNFLQKIWFSGNFQAIFRPIFWLFAVLDSWGIIKINTKLSFLQFLAKVLFHCQENENLFQKCWFVSSKPPFFWFFSGYSGWVWGLTCVDAGKN